MVEITEETREGRSDLLVEAVFVVVFVTAMEEEDGVGGDEDCELVDDCEFVDDDDLRPYRLLSIKFTALVCLFCFLICNCGIAYIK